jgi:disulfide bond formation protein DsbB
MIAHVVALYGTCAVLLTLTAASFGPKRRPIRLLWPFFALAVVEALALTAAGHLIAQWLLPLATMAFVARFSRSDALVRRARAILVGVSVACMVHGWYLRGHGYAAAGPVVVAPGRRVVAVWHTPLTGLSRVYR